MTVHEWVRGASARLALGGVEASRLEAQLLAAHAQGTDRTAVLAHPRAVAPHVADDLLARRLSGEPLAYILGYREFYGRRFTVTPDVLIPRQETEHLVEWAITAAPRDGRLLDVGVGSGCVAITVKLERPDLTVVGVDISPAALGVAQGNAAALDARVKWIESDLYAAVTGDFDIIVSNPPYIEDDAKLPREIREHEPHVALFGGATGLDVYQRLAECEAHLSPGGQVAVELGDGMAARVVSVFERHKWKTAEIRKDLGGVERVLVLARST